MHRAKIITTDPDEELYEFFMSPHYEVVLDELERIKDRTVSRILATKATDDNLSTYKACYDGMNSLLYEFIQHRVNLVKQRNNG